jgi:hypothetical protein
MWGNAEGNVENIRASRVTARENRMGMEGATEYHGVSMVVRVAVVRAMRGKA